MARKSKRNSAPKSNGNRLVGWLVSYGLDDLGFSYELRSGRTFIAADDRTDMRTLAVDEGSISSPHLAVRADGSHSVFVQDIFSEHGSYITRAGDKKEEEVTGPIELNHGDWIRVGEHTRFQVCLIDGPSR